MNATNVDPVSKSEEVYRKFFRVRTPRGLARLLGVKFDQLAYYADPYQSSQSYVSFQVPKKSGGVRIISAPEPELRLIQQKLNSILQHVFHSKRKPSVHGYVFERSIITNARCHSGRRYVFNVDLEDFFPSITFWRIRGLFIAKPYTLNPAVADLIARICCLHLTLPQGAPTSPIISNMICARMDSELQRLAKSYRCFYTRYADDLSFSTYTLNFPSALATLNVAGQASVGAELNHLIAQNGFQVNHAKVSLQTRSYRQVVTGLTVNRFPNLQRRYVSQIRAMLHAWKKYGLEAAQKEFSEKYDNKRRKESGYQRPFRFVVRGKIEFLGAVRGRNNTTYRRFLAQLKELDDTLVKHAGSVTYDQGDPLSLLEQKMDELLRILGRNHARYLDALTYHHRLRENIDKVRLYEDTELTRAARNELHAQLNRFSHETTSVYFDELLVDSDQRHSNEPNASKSSK